MDGQRLKGAKLGRLAKVRAKGLILAAVLLAIGVVSVAVGAGAYWAVAFGAVSVVLLLQVASSWRNARLQTERFQQLRNRLDTLDRNVKAAVKAQTGAKPSPQPTQVGSQTAKAPHVANSSSQQMVDLQRELDYLLWRVSSVRATDESTIHSEPREGLRPSDLLGGESAR